MRRKTYYDFKVRRPSFNLPGLKKISFLKVLFILFFIGMIYGALLVGLSDSGIQNKLAFLTQEFVNKRTEQSIVFTFFSSFGSSMMLLIILFLLGFWAIGQPAALFVPIFRGLGLGMSMAQMYVAYNFKGVLFCLILILPQVIISTIGLLLGTRESVRFSNVFFRYFLPGKYDPPESGLFKMYLLKFIVLTGFMAASAAVDGICTFLFAGFFQM